MTITIYTNGAVSLDGRPTGLHFCQASKGSIVYTPENSTQKYAEHAMPHARYSLAHEKPASGAAGRSQFEQDLRALLVRLNDANA